MTAILRRSRLLAALVLAAALAFAAPALAGVSVDAGSLISSSGVISETLGPELVVDGGFTDSANWTEGAGWAIASAKMQHTAGTGTLVPAVALVAEIGTVYKFCYTVSAWSVAGTAIAFGGNTFQASTLPAADGTFCMYAPPAVSTATLTFTPVTGLRADIDDVSLKAVTSTITPASGPVSIYKDLANATANETALNVTGNQTGAAGNKVILGLNYVGTAGAGSESLIVGRAGGVDVFVVNTLGNLSTPYFSTLNQSGGAWWYTSVSAPPLTIGLTGDLTNSNSFGFKLGAYADTTSYEYTGSSIIQDILNLRGEMLQTSTAGYNGIHLQVAEQTTAGGGGSGAQNLMVLSTTANDYTTEVEKFKVSRGGLITSYAQAVTCADDAAGTNAAVTITPTSSYIEVASADAQGCDVTMAETGMSVGSAVTICIVSVTAGAVNFADTAGVTQLAGAFASNVDDCITLRYGNTTTWREVSRSAN
jgi:hypothetical protein